MKGIKKQLAMVSLAASVAVGAMGANAAPNQPRGGREPARQEQRSKAPAHKKAPAPKAPQKHQQPRPTHHVKAPMPPPPKSHHETPPPPKPVERSFWAGFFNGLFGGR